MHDLLISVLHPILLSLGSLLAAALVGLVASFMKKNGIEMTAAQHDLLTKIVNEGIDYAEEKAANAGGGSGTAKHAMAVAYIQAKLPDVTSVQASDAIHANLPTSGSGAGAANSPTVDPVSGRPAT